jgi:hypothetical protein
MQNSILRQSPGCPLYHITSPLSENDTGEPHRPPILVIGAGFSNDLSPSPPKLFAEMRPYAEAQLHFTPSPAATDLYKWADEVIVELDRRGDINPKLTLAQALQIPSDPRWGAYIRTYRSQPRHRVVARFAREELWKEIWSFNWDCWQENALEAVGIKRGHSNARLPWPTTFSTFVTAADCHGIAAAGTIVVIKPHGCVTALLDAEQATRKGNQLRARALADQFIITRTELDGMRPDPGAPAQQFIFARLCNELPQRPLVIAGWSISELYLVEFIRTHVAPILAQNELAVDELSIIDLVFNGQGHAQLATFYLMNRDGAHIPVVSDAGFTTDRLFLWLQALFGLHSLWNVAEAARAVVQDMMNTLEQPPERFHWVISFVDNFLPAWVRLCWRCELVNCYDTHGHQIPADAISLESPEEHIPWKLSRIDRPDLRAASRLIGALNPDWNYEFCPGGLYRAGDKFLIIPVPAWSIDHFNDLLGLKLLVESVKKSGAGFIERLAILPLGSQDNEIIAPPTISFLKALVARQFPFARFAQSSNIEHVELADL